MRLKQSQPMGKSPQKNKDAAATASLKGGDIMTPYYDSDGYYHAEVDGIEIIFESIDAYYEYLDG